MKGGKCVSSETIHQSNETLQTLELIYLKHLEKLSESCQGHVQYTNTGCLHFVFAKQALDFDPPPPSHPNNKIRNKTYKQGENGVTLHFLSLRPSQRKTGNLEQGEARGNLVLCCPASWAGSSTTRHQPLPTCCTLAPRGKALLRMTTLFLSLLTAQFPMCANEQGIHIHKEKEITSPTSKIWNTHRVEDASNVLFSRAARITHSKNAGRSLVRSSSVTTVRWGRVQGNRNNHQRLKGKYVQGALSPAKGEQGLCSYQRCCSWI